jgi:carboxylesterase type B
LQSPALPPFRNTSSQEQVFQDFLSILNVSTLAEARALPSSAVISANIQQQAQSPYGEFIYGPVVDGIFVPDFFGRLLLTGSFDPSVEVMVAHNFDEGPLFTDPSITDNAGFNTFVRSFFPAMTDTLAAYVEDVLYPPVFDGSQPYTNDLDRAILLNSDILISCNTFYLDTAFHNETYAYLFDVPPAIHGVDLSYTFYTGPFGASYNTPLFNTTIAVVLQDYVTSFATNGKPVTEVAGVPAFSRYGQNGQVLKLSSAGITNTKDPAANQRCRWWQLGLGWH